PLVKWAAKYLPMKRTSEEGKFFVRENGRWFATPLFIVLLVIESTDVVFAVDSIPAILAISKDPFIVYTSNVFALLGLRALYFAFALPAAMVVAKLSVFRGEVGTQGDLSH